MVVGREAHQLQPTRGRSVKTLPPPLGGFIKESKVPKKKPASEPAKGKAKVHKTSDGKKVSYGEKGAEVKPGTSKGDSYCARSEGIKKEMIKKGGKSAEKARDPDSPNNLSRKRWKCDGPKSKK
jgi:hypothetical protein